MTEIEPDRAAVAAYWADFCAVTATTGEPADVYAFGDSAEIADRLVGLVLDGTKRATAGAMVDHAEEGRIPQVGDHQVVVDGSGTPVAVVRTTEVRVGWLSSVDAAFAWDEGEGDRTRDWWVAAHLGFFARTYAAAGRELDLDPELVFERFELVWPDDVVTERLRLRRWSDADRPAFAAMNADPEVMEHLPEVLDREVSDGLLDRFRSVWAERGIGLWAVERRSDGAFLGWAGLNPMPDGTPGAGEWEVGWRLVRSAWGQGYATEAAREALRVARDLGAGRVWSMTSPGNLRSLSVMRRLGMVEHSTFEYARFPQGHRLRTEVVYVIDLEAVEVRDASGSGGSRAGSR